MTSGRCKNTFWGILLILILGMLPSNASANGSTASDVSVEVQSSILVSISDAAIDATMDEVSVASSVLNVMSNNATGYNTYISTASLSTDLKHTTTEDIIPTIAGSTSKASFPLNHWGFSLDDSTYQGMPDSDNAMEIASASLDAAGETSTDIYFATKVDANMTSGTYSNTMVVTVVPNYVPLSLAESYHYAGKTRVTTDDGRKYFAMQDMTPEICVVADKEHSSLQVIDERDNKVYWITKLKDGNCWMTQNLDFDIAEDNVTPELSDVTTAWNSSSAYPPQTTSTEIFNNSDSTGTYSYDPGNKYLPSGTDAATDMDCSIAENKENCHYHVGNYYQYNAATAGTGGTLVDQDALSSICPKGWRLPTGNSYTENYSFGKLTNAYGITNSANGTSDSVLLSSPLFFARGGYIYSGSLDTQGSSGRYWSSKAHSNASDAYRLYFHSSDVTPSLNGNRSLGFSVRCVAHGNAISLTYNANGGTNAPSATIAESNSTSATITISSTIPTREHYNFLGWATSSTATTPDYVYSDGSFTPSTITVTGNQTLYAVWEGPIFYMQDVTSWMDDLELEQQVQVVDSRDNKIYWVAKLKDGNIWMTQNLDYDLSVTSNQTLTPATSNVITTRTVTPVSWGSDYNSVYYKDGGDDYYANGTTKTSGYSSLPANDINRHYAVGDYYSWKAATAGQGTTSITDADVTESICPAGWRLPTSNSADANYSFGNLVKQYGYTGTNQSGTTDATLLASPLFFARGGYVSSGSLYYQGSDGRYWSSRAYSSSNNAYDLYFGSSRVYPSNYNDRYYGFSVRCVAIDPTLNDISTMQEMTPRIVAKTPEGTTKQLIDTRDNKLYWVTKLKDGNIWMTQNLDYDIVAGDNIVSNNDGTTSIWNASSTYASQATITSVFNNSSDTGTYSYDPGSNYIPNGTGTPTAITCTSANNGGENCHYHQGNYYQYNAATAGTGETITNTDATSSICPKGWRLPTSNSYTENYSFGKLTNAYGITNNSDGSSDSALLSSPLFFARGGNVYSGSLGNQGSYGDYWSSRAYSDTNNAYGLYFGSSLVSPSYNLNRNFGFSVRCVAL